MAEMNNLTNLNKTNHNSTYITDRSLQERLEFKCELANYRTDINYLQTKIFLSDSNF